MAGVAAATAGLVMLLAQVDLPGMRDVASFERAVTDLYDLADQDGNFQRASRKFHELREAHDNGKGFLVDLGACLLICGVLLAVLAWRLPVSARLRLLILQTHRLWLVALIGVVAACLLGVGVSMQALAIFDRFEVPPWADSLAIPLAGSAILTVFVCAFVLVFVGLPHLRRRPPGVSLLVAPRRTVGGIIALLIYGPLALFFAFVGVVMFGTTASWLLTPVMLLFAWLMLHARVVASA